MPWRDLSKKLDYLSQRRPICLLGAGYIDQIIELPTLPVRGGDVEATSRLMNIGGCALNVATALRRLDMWSYWFFLVPYLERDFMRPFTPTVSSAPRMMW